MRSSVQKQNPFSDVVIVIVGPLKTGIFIFNRVDAQNTLFGFDCMMTEAVETQPYLLFEMLAMKEVFHSCTVGRAR